MSLTYKNYSSVNNYKNRTHSKFDNLYGVNRYSIVRSAVMVGLAAKGYKTMAREVKEWKIKTIDTFVDMSSNPYEIKSIEQLETSEKVGVSYFVGMVFAHLHMQKEYNIPILEHLKNDGIEVIPYKDKNKRPDLWGYNRSTLASYLVEAKGSTSANDYMKSKVIEGAADQLEAIKEIRYHTSKSLSPSIFSGTRSNMKKLIIATHPEKNGEIHQAVIDPPESDDIVIELDGDESVFKYYFNLVKLLQSTDNQPVIRNVNGIDREFKLIKLGNLNCSIGLISSIYNYFNNFIQEGKEYSKADFRGADTEVNQILNQIEEFTDEKVDFGIDGVIVLED